MKVIGKGKIKVYDPVDECPHAPGKEPFWQESIVLYFWDTQQQVYAFFRMSQEPNRGGGFTTMWVNVWTPDWIYKHTDDSVPLRQGDRTENALSSDGGKCRYQFDGKHNWEIRDTDIQVRLSMEDYHPGFGFYDETAGSVVSEAAKEHIEGTGWITGSVSVKGRSYTVSGPGFRDHSWGKRDWSTILVNRFFPATFGKEFTLFGITFMPTDGTLSKFATVSRGDTIQSIDDFTIISRIGEDGTSNYGGTATFRLDGETHVIDYVPVGKGAISLHQGFPCVDTMCTVTMGNKKGVGVFETSHRAQGGTGKLHVYPESFSILDNGFHRNKPIKI